MEITEIVDGDVYEERFVIFQNKDAEKNDYWIAVCEGVEFYKYLSGIGKTPQDALKELKHVMSNADYFRGESK